LHLRTRFRTFLHYRANAGEEIQALVNFLLRIRRVRTLLRRRGAALDFCTSGVPSTHISAIAILLLSTSARIVYRTSLAVADTSHLAALLPTTLTALSTLLSLTLLTALTLLAALLSLTQPALLTLLSAA